MGVNGLTTYCNREKTNCSELVDLCKIARQHTKFQLLIDYGNFKNSLAVYLSRFMLVSYKNPYIGILGSEFQTLNEYLTKFVTTLENGNISLVWCKTRSKGMVAGEYDQSQLKRWDKRHKANKKMNEKIKDVCFEKAEIVKLRNIIFSHGFAAQIDSTLKDLRCEVLYFHEYFCDHQLVKILKSRPEAFAIVSSDSNYLVFEECNIIRMEHLMQKLKCDSNTFLNNNSVLSELIIPVFQTSKILQHLGFENHDQFIDLSILAGNIFTAIITRDPTFLTDVGLVLNTHWPTFSDHVNWIRKYKRLENHVHLRNALRDNADFRNVVQLSRAFYKLQLSSTPVATCPSADDENIILEKVYKGQYPPDFLAIFHQHYWYNVQHEWPEEGCCYSEEAFRPLRKLIYSIILPFHRNSVTEHIRLLDRDVYEEQVITPEWDNVTLPYLLDVTERGLVANLMYFRRIMSHIENFNFHCDYFELYGRKEGFIMYMLRYFLILNWERNLCISKEEFYALAAVSLLREHEDAYQYVKIRPHPRTVTIANWYLVLYKYCFYYLSAIFYLTSEFPEPNELFSGSVWMAFHACYFKPVADRFKSSGDLLVLEKAKTKLNMFLHEKRDQIECIVTRIFK